MTIRPSHLFPAAIAAALALALGACGTIEKEPAAGSSADPSAGTSSAPASDPAGIETVKAGVLTVCTNPPYAPFEEVLNNEVVGFDMDLTAEVAADLGLTVEFVQAPFESIESAASLDTGTCDVGASALTITPERQAKMEFSQPYYQTTMGLLVKAESGISDLAGLADKPVGVQQGTTGEDCANQQPELTQIKQYESLGDQVTALKAGDVVGIFNDEPTLTPYIDEGFTVVSSFDTGEAFGFAVKQGNQGLLEAINATLDRVNSDGTYESLIEKWFQSSAQ
ncbi:MAG: transporter substrate-binding domain-containing protein [Bifidobacteriaceae bacterium]|jgi:polar amino acid transport system substrate-binding protein|nr:transporter substrate-binding domain-containing protein [Bifidobacteriaceae bacterium]